MRPSSAARKPRSNGVLWPTSTAPSRIESTRSATWAKGGASAKSSSDRPFTASAPAPMWRWGLISCSTASMGSSLWQRRMAISQTRSPRSGCRPVVSTSRKARGTSSIGVLQVKHGRLPHAPGCRARWHQGRPRRFLSGRQRATAMVQSSGDAAPTRPAGCNAARCDGCAIAFVLAKAIARELPIQVGHPMITVDLGDNRGSRYGEM